MVSCTRPRGVNSLIVPGVNCVIADTRSTQLYIHLAPTEVAHRIRDATAAFDAGIRRLIEEHVGGSPAP
jgi:hypothetical protein